MYQISYITDMRGIAKEDPESLSYLGCVGEAKMEDGCVLFHCRSDRWGEPCDRYIRTSIVKDWRKDKETGRIVVQTMNSVYCMDPVRD